MRLGSNIRAAWKSNSSSVESRFSIRFENSNERSSKNFKQSSEIFIFIKYLFISYCTIMKILLSVERDDHRERVNTLLINKESTKIISSQTTNGVRL